MIVGPSACRFLKRKLNLQFESIQDEKSKIKLMAFYDEIGNSIFRQIASFAFLGFNFRIRCHTRNHLLIRLKCLCPTFFGWMWCLSMLGFELVRPSSWSKLNADVAQLAEQQIFDTMTWEFEYRIFGSRSTPIGIRPFYCHYNKLMCVA